VYHSIFQQPPNFGSDTYEDMNFSRNKLKKLPSYAFENFPGLISLNLSYNFIVEVNILIYFKMSQCLLTIFCLQLDASAFKGLGSLEVLDISNNSLVYINPQFLTPCPGIMWLSLAKNEFVGKEINKVMQIRTQNSVKPYSNVVWLTLKIEKISKYLRFF